MAESAGSFDQTIGLLSTEYPTVSEVFISYAQRDGERVGLLAERLADEGWSVFWDRTIPVGSSWAESIGTKLDSAGCVVVVWSKSSIGSQWVLAEARKGLEKKVLIPICIDEVEPPMPFGEVQHADLVGWEGDSAAPEFQRVVSAVSELLGRAGEQRPSAANSDSEPAKKEPPSQSGPSAQISTNKSTGSDDAQPTEADSHSGRQRKAPARLLGVGLLAGIAIASVTLYLTLFYGQNPAPPKDAKRGPAHDDEQASSDGERTNVASLQAKLDPNEDTAEPCKPWDLGEIEHRQEFRDCLADGTLGPEMVVIHPLPECKVSERFAIGRYEIMVAEFENFCESTGRDCGESDIPPDLPITRVSWNEAQAYVKWLSAQTGARYRLPYAGEWRFADRGDRKCESTKTFWWGNLLGKDNANCNDCNTDLSDNGPAPVKSLKPNHFGLYNTTGNVYEWTTESCVADVCTDEDSELRPFVIGGSWKSNLEWKTEAGQRIEKQPQPGSEHEDVGFRVIRY